MKKQYNNFVEVERVLQLLDIQEVTTSRQKANGTREFKLPVRDQYGGPIHVASFASGYVRRTKAGGYCPSWQLNKRIDGEPEYFETGKKDWTGKPLYRQFTTSTCKLIPNEQDRLEYLISFCLKNYYIGYANKLSNGDYVPKWKHEDLLSAMEAQVEGHNVKDVQVIIDGHRYNVIWWDYLEKKKIKTKSY